MAPVPLSLHLGPSKLWWAWLGFRSNPALTRLLASGYARAVVFDEIFRLPPTRPRTLYCFVRWDGVPEPGVLEQVRAALGPDAALYVLVVGESGVVGKSGDVGETGRSVARSIVPQPLYPEGPLQFDQPPPRLHPRSRLLLAAARVKTLTMPFKNLVAGRADPRAALLLLLGPGRFVFCGSYGLTPPVLASFCVRYGVDPALFGAFPVSPRQPEPTEAAFLLRLRQGGTLLATLFDRGKLHPAFLLGALHLLGREFFLRQIGASGWPLFLNGYGTGVNINVYTTPWYRQHIFLDFGSVVGQGNYPRRADLRFFRKRAASVDLGSSLDDVLPAARAGRLDLHFLTLWQRDRPGLHAALSPARP